MNRQTQSKKSDIPHLIWESGVVENYSPSFADDSFIDAVSEISQGKPFAMEMCVVPVVRFFHRDTVGYKCVIRIFDNNQQLFDFVNEYGEHKLTETYYSAIL